MHGLKVNNNYYDYCCCWVCIYVWMLGSIDTFVNHSDHLWDDSS